MLIRIKCRDIDKKLKVTIFTKFHTQAGTSSGETAVILRSWGKGQVHAATTIDILASPQSLIDLVVIF